jgi:crooked neck
MPKAVKKRRKVENPDGTSGDVWEEYYDYLFPDDETERPNLKLFQMAHAWKEKLKMGVGLDSDDDEDEEDEVEDEVEAEAEKGDESSDGEDDGAERKRKRDEDDQ